MVKYLLEFGCGIRAPSLIEVRLTAQVGDLEKSVSFKRAGRLQQLNCLRGITFLQFNARSNERQQDFIEHSVVRKTLDQIINNSLCLAELAAGSQCIGG